MGADHVMSLGINMEITCNTELATTEVSPL